MSTFHNARGITDESVFNQNCLRASGSVLEHEATTSPAEFYEPVERPLSPAAIREIRMDQTRRSMVDWGFKTVILTISVPALVMVGASFFPNAVDYQPAKEWMQAIIPIELSILSGAFGYYFGKKQ